MLSKRAHGKSNYYQLTGFILDPHHFFLSDRFLLYLLALFSLLQFSEQAHGYGKKKDKMLVIFILKDILNSSLPQIKRINPTLPFQQRNLLLYSMATRPTTMQATAERNSETMSEFLMQLKVRSRVNTDESIHCIPLIPLPLISTQQLFTQWSHIDLFITKFIKTFPLFFAISVRDGCCRVAGAPRVSNVYCC